ncbi:MAG: ATP-binding cassette domain-containing protein [Saprospiraceae bacterium]|nr:ATP-binding cassette domain-containing protein [Saprospiraceae bacterium]MBK8451129.1 ATP-binding cassette domain-containing protein [Saprospiraceae bacterium]MBK9722544.1 ATP-binding cassette domain-containing protein [Saprospiraceae bacterium]MBK9729563.1 ATP-binding cassette domain-containing protein [Saprospiraceae bacterium]
MIQTIKSIDPDNLSPIKFGEPIIEIKNLEKAFGKNQVLIDYNLEIRRGENLVILGKSGSGKSVLIKCIVGLLSYDAGSLKVFGNEISEIPQQALDEMRARIGFVFQSSALYDSMTVRENLEFPLRRHGKNKTKEEINELVEETLNNVGLLHAMNLMPSELSGGMKKRIGLARSLILKPEIMLYDEPTTGLDPITAKEISYLMLQVQQKYNTSSIIISHDMHCAKLTANRISVLIDGINYAQGTYDELNNLKDPKIHAFFE